MAEVEHFAIDFGSIRPLMSLFGMGPSSSGLKLADDSLHVHVGWAFRATVPRSSITTATPYEGNVMTLGIHGWRGRWLINGSKQGIVHVEIRPTARAHMIGIPVHLHDLVVSLADPERFTTALGKPV